MNEGEKMPWAKGRVARRCMVRLQDHMLKMAKEKAYANKQTISAWIEDAITDKAARDHVKSIE